MRKFTYFWFKSPGLSLAEHPHSLSWSGQVWEGTSHTQGFPAATHANTQTHTHTGTHTDTHAHIGTHACTQAHTHMYTGTHTHTHRLVPDSLTKMAFPLHLISSMYVGFRLLTRKKPGHKSSSLEVSSKMESGPCLHQEGDRGRSEVNLSSCGVGVTSLVSIPSLGFVASLPAATRQDPI